MPKNNDSSQGDGGNPPPPAAAAAGTGAGAGGVTAEPQDFQRSRNGNKVYKSGPLFLSSRGIGWTSWKKRWFILTHTSLVFFRSDPNVVSQKGNEVNLTLGGIDLNSSGSVVVKADKKLLTVLFPDGRDGRAFTLKAETSEDLFEWKAALEEALANAPSAGVGMGQNGILKNDKGDVAADGSQEQSKDRQPAKSFVVGAPILLALEDIDGTPSFLEKALRFIEEYGVKVEGILRQAADVDDVERRIREYEQGKSEFSSEEDAHIIGDCIKYVLRELPSSPVPASCCNALLEAFRTDRSMRVSNMRGAICETFPEPNRRLLQRILMMMQTVASHKTVNRMSVSAVAACMAPLLLRPLLAGDCELDNDFDMGGDGSVQLLQAAAAANHAQAIVITLLEEYENIFGEGSMSTDLYSDSEVSGSESEELSDDDETYEEDEEGDEYTSEGSNEEEDFEQGSNVTCSETGDDGDSDEHDDKGSDALSSNSISRETSDDFEDSQKLSPSSQRSSSQYDKAEVNVNTPTEYSNHSTAEGDEPGEQLDDDSVELSPTHGSAHSFKKSRTRSNGPSRSSRRNTVWGRTGAKKNLSTESIDVVRDDESEIQKLELTKADLEHKIAKEARGNARLQQDILRRKNALKERRLALEQDDLLQLQVARLQEELQKERELRTALEAGVKNPQVALPLPASISEKTKADLEEIVQAEADIATLKHKADDLGVQLNQQHEQNSVFGRDPSNQPAQASNQGKMKDKEKDIEALTTSRGEKTRSKDTHSSKAHDDKDVKQQAHANRHLPPNQQSDALRNLRSAGTQATSASPGPGIGKSSSTNSKRSSSKGEGANTTSALSKLTNRLNFLKERRNQIANELQSIDKGKHSAGQPTPKGGKRSELPLQVTSTDKPQESEGQSSEKGKGLDNSHLSTDRAVAAEGSLHQNVDTSKKPDVQSTDKGRKSDGQSAPNLEKGRSESLQNAEKGRSSGAATTRTSSR